MESIIDATYGDITLLASLTCETPVAAITLLDSERQWFKVPVGITVESTSRRISFCGHAILHDDILIVNNAHQDARFFDNPLVLGSPQICFYAGVPLVTSKGANLGTLCVMDYKDRTLNRAQIFSLETLARQVINQLEAAVTTTDLSVAVLRLNTFLNHMNFGVLVESEERQVSYVNAAFCHMFNLPQAQEAQGIDSRKIFERMQSLFKFSKNFIPRMEEIVASHQPAIGEELLFRDGRVFERDYIPTVAHELCKGHLWIYHDVTARKEAEMLLENQRMQIITTSRMAAIGEMAAGIAHEVNNPLAIIHGKAHYLDLLSQRDRLDSKAVTEAAQIIKNTSMRINRIIQNLRAFANEDINEPFEEIAAESIVIAAVTFCESRFAFHGVRLEVFPIPENAKIWCRPIPLTQVLFNLLNNAFDAALSACNDRWIQLKVLDFESSISIEITDCGEGIPLELHDKIVLPFFTTKEPGKGTGLGLSFSKGIVESHNGRIYIDRNAKNTTFIVELPKHPQEG